MYENVVVVANIHMFRISRLLILGLPLDEQLAGFYCGYVLDTHLHKL